MIKEVYQYTAKKTGLERVVFVLYDEPAYQAFKQELNTQIAKEGWREELLSLGEGGCEGEGEGEVDK